MNNILVATDLSERSGLALTRAALIAKQQNAVLHIAYVIDDGLPATVAADCETSATEELTRIVTEGAPFKGVTTRIHVDFGHPWQVVTRLAQELDADLLVMGLHRNRGFRELFGGTTLHRTAHSTECPLLVVAERTTGPYETPLVGCDFSDCARHAADLTTQLVPDHPMTLVHAYHIPFKGLTQRTDIKGEVSEREKKRVETAVHARMWDFVATLENPHRSTAILAREGGPIKVLEAEVNALGADLVCIGSHGKSWIVEAILGSTAEELLSFPPCDVLLTPLR